MKKNPPTSLLKRDKFISNQDVMEINYEFPFIFFIEYLKCRPSIILTNSDEEVSLEDLMESHSEKIKNI